MNYFEEIKKALIAKGAKGNITKETEFRSLGLDSLDLMDMVITLEEKLNISLSDDQVMSMQKISDLIQILEELLNTNE
ncbi:acyl carrier protein [Spiroplasma clarkii]|uniref:Acyl carrier protein n=1 Tax=Spiroplasma clarkii TaxID=2139 RepID=A0A2K8KFY7_9MOLU|nr:acyl carrier protein [Spiroplasma clarkii]ATX70595.1 acyl carrier protein [Spiroplasma clarkii]